jgi:hypothetical protein
MMDLGFPLVQAKQWIVVKPPLTGLEAPDIG